MIKLTQLINELELTNDMRIHTSKKSFELEPRTFTQKFHAPKPDGFWYGFGSEWFDWSRANLPDAKHGKYIYSVDIGNTNILQIKTYEELVQFSQTYEYENEISKMLHKIRGLDSPINRMFRGNEFGLVNWEKVVSKYDGIEINPHQDEAKRNSYFYYWYSNWDVASGCVWNLSGVKLKLLTDTGIE